MSYKLRDSLDQETLNKLYGLKRRLERGKIKELNNKTPLGFSREALTTIS